MSSAFHHIFKFDNSGNFAGHTDGASTFTHKGVTYDRTNDDSLGLCPLQAVGSSPSASDILAGNISKTFVLPSDAKDFAVCNIADGCDCRMAIQMSPDGVNWCDCVDVNLDACNNISCTVTSGTCTCKVISVPMLQYVRVVLYGGDSSGGVGKVSIHWTTF